MTALRLLSYGLMCGLSEREAWQSNPGRIADLFLYMREYHDEQHGIRRKSGAGSDD